MKTMENTLRYYDVNSELFAAQTLDLDMSAVYARFLRHVPSSGHILDAGCGAGRDTAAFTNMGYRVTAFDASKEMVNIARQQSGQAVIHASFSEFDSDASFAGIWACASLLHEAPEDLTHTLKHLSQFLTINGAFYMSFKTGTGIRTDGERQFLDMTAVTLSQYVEPIKELAISDLWLSQDVRGAAKPAWLNAILKKR